MVEVILFLVKTGLIGGTVGGLSFGLYKGIQRVGLRWIEKIGNQIIRGGGKIMGIALAIAGKALKGVGKGVVKCSKLSFNGGKKGYNKLSEFRRVKKAEKAYKEGLLNEDAFLDVVRNNGKDTNLNRRSPYQQNRRYQQGSSNIRYANDDLVNRNRINSEYTNLSPNCLKFIKYRCKELNISPLHIDRIIHDCSILKDKRAYRNEKFSKGDVDSVLSNYIETEEFEVKNEPLRKDRNNKINRNGVPKRKKEDKDSAVFTINVKDRDSLEKVKSFIDSCFDNIDTNKLDEELKNANGLSNNEAKASKVDNTLNKDKYSKDKVNNKDLDDTTCNNENSSGTKFNDISSEVKTNENKEEDYELKGKDSKLDEPPSVKIKDLKLESSNLFSS